MLNKTHFRKAARNQAWAEEVLSIRGDSGCWAAEQVAKELMLPPADTEALNKKKQLNQPAPNPSLDTETLVLPASLST